MVKWTNLTAFFSLLEIFSTKGNYSKSILDSKKYFGVINKAVAIWEVRVVDLHLQNDDILCQIITTLEDNFWTILESEPLETFFSWKYSRAKLSDFSSTSPLRQNYISLILTVTVVYGWKFKFWNSNVLNRKKSQLSDKKGLSYDSHYNMRYSSSL